MIRFSSRVAPIAVFAVLAFTLSCVSDSSGPTGVATAVSGAAPKLLGNQLLACTPMDADSVTQEIGPSGGTIDVGPHRLIFFPNALDSTVSITAVAPSDTVNRVLLYPEGLTFNATVILRMSYANCGIISVLIPKSIVYLDGLNIADILSSLDNFFQKRVSTTLPHFSGYAVAW